VLELFIAAVAGFVSFISPCVLPLVPAYIGYMGGRMTNTVSAQVAVGADGTGVLQSSGPSMSMRFSTFIHGLAFVAGFTTIFVILGIISTAFISTFGSTATIEGVIGRVGGVLIILFGLHFMGAFPPVIRQLRKNSAIQESVLTSVIAAVVMILLLSWGFTNTFALWDTSAYPGWAGALAYISIAFVILGMFAGGAFTTPGNFWNKFLNTVETSLYSDTRRQITASGDKGLPGSALMGVVFAAGWSPCIGPTLGAAMTIAANGGDVTRAALLMGAYSLGLGIPFLLTALMLDSAQGMLLRLKQHMNTLKLVSGGFLVVIGVFVASGSLQDLSTRFSNDFADVSIRIEECVVGTLEGDIGLSQTGTCLSGGEDFRVLRAEHLGTQEALDAVPAALRESVDLPVSENVSEEVDPQAGLVNEAPSISEAAESASPVEGLAVGNLAPNFTTTTTEGEEVSLHDFRGEVVLLNFWFTECGPCRIEMPEFQNVYEKYQDDGFTILAVNREEEAETIEEFAEPLGLEFPLLLDLEGDIQFQYNIFGYPSTLLIDRDGVIQFRSFSALTEAQIQEIVGDAFS